MRKHTWKRVEPDLSLPTPFDLVVERCLLASMMLALLAGCGSKDEPAPEEESASTAEAEGLGALVPDDAYGVLWVESPGTIGAEIAALTTQGEIARNPLAYLEPVLGDLWQEIDPKAPLAVALVPGTTHDPFGAPVFLFHARDVKKARELAEESLGVAVTRGTRLAVSTSALGETGGAGARSLLEDLPAGHIRLRVDLQRLAPALIAVTSTISRIDESLVSDDPTAKSGLEFTRRALPHVKTFLEKARALEGAASFEQGHLEATGHLRIEGPLPLQLGTAESLIPLVRRLPRRGCLRYAFNVDVRGIFQELGDLYLGLDFGQGVPGFGSISAGPLFESFADLAIYMDGRMAVTTSQSLAGAPSVVLTSVTNAGRFFEYSKKKALEIPEHLSNVKVSDLGKREIEGRPVQVFAVQFEGGLAPIEMRVSGTTVDSSYVMMTGFEDEAVAELLSPMQSDTESSPSMLEPLLASAGEYPLFVGDFDVATMVQHLFASEPPPLQPSRPGQVSVYVGAEEDGYRAGFSVDLKTLVELGR